MIRKAARTGPPPPWRFLDQGAVSRSLGDLALFFAYVRVGPDQRVALNSSLAHGGAARAGDLRQGLRSAP